MCSAPLSTRPSTSPNSTRVARWLTLLVLLVWLPSMAAGYQIILKDGTVIQTASEYRVDGDRALFELLNGTTSTIALAEIDVERTREANVRNLGDATVIGRDGSVGQYDPSARTEQREPDTLRQLLQRRAALADSSADEDEAPKSRALRRTAAGYPDFSTIQRTPPEAQLSQELNRLLASTGLTGFSLYAGTTDDRVLVELTSNSEGQVLDQLTRLGAALFDFLGSQQRVETIEVFMRTGSLSRAGQFELDREAARMLVRGEVSPRDFFVANVQF